MESINKLQTFFWANWPRLILGVYLVVVACLIVTGVHLQFSRPRPARVIQPVRVDSLHTLPSDQERRLQATWDSLSRLKP